MTLATPCIADAGTIVHLNYGLNPDNTTPVSTDGPRRQKEGRVTNATGSVNEDYVCYRYASINALDVAELGNVEQEGQTCSYWVEFGVTEDPGTPWRIKIDARRRGAWTIVDDNGAYAKAYFTSPFYSSYSVNNPPQSGSLPGIQFGIGDGASNEGSSGTSPNIAFDDAGTAFIDGTGTGSQQVVHLSFTWSNNVYSHGGPLGGDEAAVRMGLPADDPNYISAGDYPGPGGRTVTDDGHFVFASLCPVAAESISASSTLVCASAPLVTLTPDDGWGTTAEWFANCCCGSPFAVTSGPIQVAPSTTTTYFMRWTSPGFTESPCGPDNVAIAACGPSGCSPGITIQVAQPTVAPTINGSASSTCAGTQVLLAAAGGSGATLKWFKDSCGGTPVALGTSYSDSPTTTTTYYARWENPPCAPSSCASYTVTVSALPVAPSSVTATSTSLCAGQPTTLTAVGGSGGTLKWYADSCRGTPAGVGSPLVVIPATTTTYYARWENLPCSPSACASITIDVSPIPVAPTSINASTTNLCSGEQSVLTAVGGSGLTLKWYKGAAPCGDTFVGDDSPIAVDPTATTTYYARWESSPCAASSCVSVTINVSSAPVAPSSIFATKTSICEGESTTLTAIGGSGATLQWFSGSCRGTPEGNTTSIIKSPTTTTTYYARWESAPCGPSICKFVTIEVSTPPVAPSSINASATDICAGSPIVLTGVGGSGNALEWYSGSCGGTPVGTGPSVAVSPTATTTYFARFESDPCDPSACASVTINVSPPPVAPALITATSTTICAGTPVTLTAAGGEGTGLQWFAGACRGTPILGKGFTLDVSPTATTTYYARWLRAPCAPSTCASITINVSTPPVAPSLITATETTICTGSSTVLSAIGGSGAAVQWFKGSCGSAISVGTGASISVSPTATTHYYARWESTPCTPSSCVDIVITVTSPPTNDDPATPLPLAAETRRVETLCSNDDPLVGSTLLRTVAFSYVPPSCGWVQLLLTPTTLRGAAVYTDPLGATTPVATGVGRVVFWADVSQTYTIFVGDVSAPVGSGFLTLIEGGTSATKTYSLTGTASGNPWAWRITSNESGFPTVDGFETLLEGSVDGTFGGIAVPAAGSSPSVVAQRFADSINFAAGSCAKAGIVGYVSGIFPILSIAFDKKWTPADDYAIVLKVGALGAPICPVTVTGVGCSFFLPLISMNEEPLPGIDCNGNGFDDFVDVFSGASLDADGNSIPDECESNTGLAFCFGDGTNTFCPCGNNGARGRGCANAGYVGGAKLGASGTAQVGADTVRFHASGVTGSHALFYQCEAQTVPFAMGDGLGCVGGTLFRLGAEEVVGGECVFPRAGDQPISVQGAIPTSGATRYYQVMYRNQTPVFCPPETTNRTNAFAITWAP